MLCAKAGYTSTRSKGYIGWGEMHPVPSRRGARSDEVPVGGADE